MKRIFNLSYIAHFLSKCIYMLKKKGVFEILPQLIFSSKICYTFYWRGARVVGVGGGGWCCCVGVVGGGGG